MRRAFIRWQIVALVVLGQLLAAPHAARLVRQNAVAHHASAAAAGALVKAGHQGKRQVQAVEARRLDPAPPPEAARVRPIPPRATFFVFVGTTCLVPAPVALLALAPKLPPPPGSVPA